MLSMFDSEIYREIERLRRAMADLDSRRDLVRVEEPRALILLDSIIIRELPSADVNCEELLRRTDNLNQCDLKIGWNTTGRANRLGYCQHATPLWDPRHLKYNTGHEFSLYK